MDCQAYINKVEQCFQKEEYITVSKLNAKMLSLPKRAFCDGCSLYCFLIKDALPSADLCDKFKKYALSVDFYKNGRSEEKVVCIPVFITSSGDEKSESFIKGYKSRGGAVCLPALFDLSDSRLILSDKKPIFAGKLYGQIIKFSSDVFSFEKN